MLVRARRFLVVLIAAFVPLGLAGAQTIPTPQQAQQVLQSNPAIIAQLQQLMQQSGLTPQQIRQRLRARGYPESMLDQYLPGGELPDSLAVPSDDVFAAIRSLGVDTLLVDSLSAVARTRRVSRARADSAFLDTLAMALKNDSLARAIRYLLRSRELQREQLDSGFAIFGLSLFQDVGGRAKPFGANTVTGGADPAYRFGPGDVLNLVITGDVEKTYPRLTVSRDGMILIPDVGLVQVAGQTRAQLDDILYRRLGAVYSGVRRGPGATTRFYVDVAQIGSNQVFVNGDVQRPNSYQVSRAATVMTALYEAGGPTETGSMRNVQVKRNGETVATFDVYDYAVRGDASRDIRLESGDVVFVPPRGPRVRVAGAVLRPATYEIKAGETLGDLFAMAGGLTPTADRRRVQIERVVPPAQRTSTGRDRIVVEVPLDQLTSAPLHGDDIVRVYEIPKKVSSYVRVRGNVWSPGIVGLTPNMTLYDAIRRAGGLKPDTYLGDVLIARVRSDSTREMLRTSFRDTTGMPVANLNLEDGDEILVQSSTAARPERFVTVGGAVREPGRKIPYRDGLTLRDAILMAGGLQEGAQLTDVEITRLPENRAGGVTGSTFKVNLDSTYLFEIGPTGRFTLPPGIKIPSGRTPEELLLPYDAIQVKWQPDWQLIQTVHVRGEVKSPGDYALNSKTERLSDIIKRAGGLTTSAYPGGIVFYRKAGSVGRIGVDLPAVLRDPDNVDNLNLVDGDSIFIPKYSQVVTVRGAVQSQVGVAYVEGAGLGYYVRSAGGATSKGDAGRTYVTQPNGKVETRRRHLLFFTSTPKPQPGSTVVVPLKDPNDKREWAQIATAATSILGSLIAIAAIVR